MVSGELKEFPLGMSDFREIRQLPGRAYFDKTEYIPELEQGGRVKLVCRPRRFGKSLTVTMLRYFHGFQFRDQYDELFKDLDVDKVVKNGIVRPGKYLILEFDFSRVDRSGNLNESAESLKRLINRGLSRFKRNYTKDLGESFASETSNFIENDPAGNLADLVEAVDFALQDIHDRGNENHPLRDVQGIYLLVDEYDAYANEYMDPHNPRSWSDAEPFRVLKTFWSNVKADGKSYYGIKKVYITGVTPLLLSGLTSGANDHENISFSPQFSTICGLTRSDVLGALEVICNNNEEVEKCLGELERNANGYHFCQQRSVERVFNTQTALSYLQSVKLQNKPEIENPPNSEVSEPFLQICAGAPAAVKDMQFALQKDKHDSYQRIPYEEEVLLGFSLPQLNTQAAGEGDMSAWRSLMVYMGGLTFDSDDPSKFLKIPNLVAAKRFGSALLDRLGLYSSIKNALYTLARTGNPMGVLAAYCHLMRQYDVIGDAFFKNEGHHRGIIQVAILENPAIKPKAEFLVRKWTNDKGFVDLLITDNKKLYTVIEFKNIQIPYLGLTGEKNIDKAEQLEAMGLNKILGLKFSGDNYRSGTIRNWIDGKRKDSISGSVRKQLQSYIKGPTVQEEIADKNFRAFAVVIVGSRQILVREMDRDGNWVNGFKLAE